MERAETQYGISDYRGGYVASIRRTRRSEWLYSRVDAFMRSYAVDVGLEVSAIVQPLQYTEYSEEAEFRWHTDLMYAGSSERKVTLSVQLTPAVEYEGGDLEVVGEAPCVWQRARGFAVAFPSFLGHRVTPLRRGTRHALVAWMHGPPLR
jgi:PKHD-type hydroxylase